MKNTFYFLVPVLVLLAVGCGQNSEEVKAEVSLQELKDRVNNYQDSLEVIQKNNGTISSLNKIELVNRYLDIYHNYPKSDEAPVALDRIHMLYSGMGAYVKSVEYADTLLELYPDYKGRALILESQGSSYDIFIQPRDTAKVRFYYNILLEENPDMDSEKRDGIVNRLKFNHLDFDSYINMKVEEMAKK
ncbi:MAG: hypothetical protein N4A41_01550 [Crocinitomicaceae bacterium]|jgi:tetratricopeptide (TPR) repeat protein|nr:hypothetical protein [Crocinitomicaceae bacterium]